MRQKIIQLGRTKSTLLFTILSMLLSVIITMSILYILDMIAFSLNTFVGLLIAMIAPMIVAPFLSWFMVGLIIEIHKIKEEMRLLATHDFLTGLLSRRAFIEQTSYVCRFAERQGMEFTILLIDLDYFKKINDKYGHAAGDKVLRSFGKIMRQISRESDLAGRIGGEEFAFFLPATNTKKASNLANRLHKAIREDIVKWDTASIKYSTSIGLAFFPQTVNDIEDALILADKALYSAKRKGRNQTVIYTPDLES